MASVGNGVQGGKMSALTDIWNMVAGIVTSADIITLVIMAVIVIGAGFAMQGMGSLVTATFGALIVFAIALYVRTIATTGSADPGTLAAKDWHAFLAWPVQGVIAYAILFGVAIAIVGFIRSLVMR
jgi:hypothetical protein